MTTKELGEIVREIRKAQDLTQVELAQASGIGIRFIIDLEKGKPTCQIGKTLHILSTLNLRVKVKPEGISAEFDYSGKNERA